MFSSALQIFYLVSTFAIWALALRRGGRPERWGVAVYVSNYVGSGVLSWTPGLQHWVVAADVALFAVLMFMMLRFDRWWLMVAAGATLAILASHWSAFSDPDIPLRIDVGSRYIFGIVGLYALGAGVFEKWLDTPPRPLMSA